MADEELRILILEDNLYDAELMQYYIREAGISLKALHVDSGAAFREALLGFSPGLILSDYDLPAFNGTEALKMAREICPEVPFILVTGAIGEEMTIEFLKGGATDYVLKNRMSRLVPAIQRALQEARERKERDDAQEALRRAHDTLELRVRERTEELEAFTYSVSHDLRGPLWMLDNYIRMLVDDYGGTIDHDLGDRIGLIWKTVKQMDHLIDDLLSLSRVNRAELCIVPLELREIVLDAWREIISLNPGREILFKMKDLPPAAGDRNLVRQALYNLLSNALKFTGTRKKPSIEVGGYRDGENSIFYVRDNGVGFDMEQYEKLFGPFQRLHGTKFAGTGVGLTIVQRIVLRHGGFVKAEGKVNGGATFLFSLPAGI